ncbi:TetR/AcrR family transcriptional regulator, partial [Nocardiopsis alba]
QFIALQDGLQIQWLLDPGAIDMRAAVVSFLDDPKIAGAHRGLDYSALVNLAASGPATAEPPPPPSTTRAKATSPL